MFLPALLAFRPDLRFCRGWDCLPHGPVGYLQFRDLPSFGTQGELLPCKPDTGRAGTTAVEQCGRRVGHSHIMCHMWILKASHSHPERVRALQRALDPPSSAKDAAPCTWQLCLGLWNKAQSPLGCFRAWLPKG